MPPTRKALIEEFMGSARSLGRTLWAAKADFFKNLKLHPGQIRVLYIVRHKPVTISEIAQSLCASPSAATQMVDALVKAGYLSRVSDRSDRRKVAVQLSASGKARFDKMRSDHMKRMAQILAVLSDAELKTLVSIQSKLAASADSNE